MTTPTYKPLCLILSVAHSASDPGATHEGFTEYDWSRAITRALSVVCNEHKRRREAALTKALIADKNVDELRERDGIPREVVCRTIDTNLTASVNAANDIFDLHRDTHHVLAVEMHLNAAPGEATHNNHCTLFTYKAMRAREAAHCTGRALNTVVTWPGYAGPGADKTYGLGTGAVAIPSAYSQRPLIWLRKVRCPSIIVEAGYIDFHEHHELLGVCTQYAVTNESGDVTVSIAGDIVARRAARRMLLAAALLRGWLAWAEAMDAYEDTQRKVPF